MSARRIIIPLLLACIVGSAAVTGQEPSLRFDPPVFEVTRDSAGWVQQMISVYSVSGDSIRLTSLNGSCRCASGSIQRPFVQDTTAGKFYVAINAQHFTDSVNYVDYTIGHTGAEGSSVYRVVVRIPEEQP